MKRILTSLRISIVALVLVLFAQHASALKLTLVIPGLSSPVVLELPDGTAVSVESNTNSPAASLLPALTERAKTAKAEALKAIGTLAQSEPLRMRKYGYAYLTCLLNGMTDPTSASNASGTLYFDTVAVNVAP